MIEFSIKLMAEYFCKTVQLLIVLKIVRYGVKLHSWDMITGEKNHLMLQTWNGFVFCIAMLIAYSDRLLYLVFQNEMYQ